MVDQNISDNTVIIINAIYLKDKIRVEVLENGPFQLLHKDSGCMAQGFIIRR